MPIWYENTEPYYVVNIVISVCMCKAMIYSFLYFQ